MGRDMFSDLELRHFFEEKLKETMKSLLEYSLDIIDEKHFKALPAFVRSISKRAQAKKVDYVNLMVLLFSSEAYKEALLEKLTSTRRSNLLYDRLIWRQIELDTVEVEGTLDIELESFEARSFGFDEEQLSQELALINRIVSYRYEEIEKDTLYIQEEIRDILKLVYPAPSEYDLLPKANPLKAAYHYTNDQGVQSFVVVLQEMLRAGLVAFSKSGEKPLLKSLKMLQEAAKIEEFYSAKGMNTLATDMLTRAFSSYYDIRRQYAQPPHEIIKDFFRREIVDGNDFFITRILTAHLKGIRFDPMTTHQKELFALIREIIEGMQADKWITYDNILEYCIYRQKTFQISSTYRGSYDYYMDVTLLYGDGYEEEDIVYADDEYYQLIFFEPVLKGALFYLGALGILELTYDAPKSPSLYLRAANKPYISVWDSLKSIKLTELGAYILGKTDSYTPKERLQAYEPIRFHEESPTMTLDPNDITTIAKLEPFTTKEGNIHRLDFAKICKGVKTQNELLEKIESFYQTIEKNPPEVIEEFFQTLKRRAGKLKKSPSHVVVELQKDPELLDLLMSNKKLQSMMIKAEGYRIVLEEHDVPKVSKILKEHGFFVEF
jgi:hypothetical protein